MRTRQAPFTVNSSPPLHVTDCCIWTRPAPPGAPEHATPQRTEESREHAYGHYQHGAGRDRAVVQKCLREVVKTVVRTLDAPLNSVRVLVNEVDPELWTVGTTLKSEERTDNPTP